MRPRPAAGLACSHQPSRLKTIRSRDWLYLGLVERPISRSFDDYRWPHLQPYQLHKPLKYDPVLNTDVEVKANYLHFKNKSPLHGDTG